MTYRYYTRRNAAILLWLWAMAFWGWGNQIMAAEATAEAAHTPLQTHQGAIAEASSNPNLTATQQEWLDRVLQKNKSYKKQFKNLLGHINHPDASIRLAAYQGLCQCLKNHSKLANKKTLQHVKKIFRKEGIRKETQEALYLLNALVDTNPKLALPTTLIVVQLTKPSQQFVTKEDVSRKAFASLIPTIVNASPDCASYFIKQIHKRTRAAEDNSIVSTSGVTVPGLDVAASLLQMDIVRDDPQYFDQVLEVVLDGASLHDIVKGNPPFKASYIQTPAQTLLKSMMQQYPTAVTTKCTKLTKKAGKEVPDMVALAYLTACAAVDHQHTAPLFLLFDDILEATNARVATLAHQLYREEREKSRHENIGGGLTGWVAGKVAHSVTKGTDKKLASNEAAQQDNREVKVPLLRLLREITTWNGACLPKAFTILQRVLSREEKSTWIRTEALATLAHTVSQGQGGDSSQLQVIRIMRSHTQDPSSEVRKEALQLLHAILKADKQQATDATVLDSLNKFRKDKNVRIRKEAEELFGEYVGS